MTDLVEEVASHVTTKIKDGLRSSPVFRVLGVGSGNGKTDLRILTGIQKRSELPGRIKAAIHSVVVEPSAEMIEEFKTSVSPLPQSLAGVADVSFEWHEMTFQKFSECFPQKESLFDMIHFVASLLYMDAETVLSYCYQKLASGGAMFCTVVPEESFFTKMSRKLHNKVDLGSAQKIYTEVDLVNIARKNNWNYEELWKVHNQIDITSCFDHSSLEGTILLDFLVFQRDFRVTAGKTLYKEVMDFLNQESSTCDNGRKLIESEIAAVVIYKEQ
ncbi:LOW QUALITY PROTEIN: histamine N-methyltransferase B-like [Orbicella faveolata]|uniref:LOW QUALITY PROTEIN: histamine N-methyltransferase B-like n=1 Tax=Orbicella faveolata TaxID=48498 RepID=UPI0009E375CF|nr:LOW QUALITY PROTEIN: histamine N-methyltransferase B-like [Orbicella faveolata]